MISAKQARKNVEQYNIWTAENFVKKIIEPQIFEASMQGKCDIVIDISKCMEVVSDVIDIVHEAGFKTECSCSGSTIRVTWYPEGATQTAHHTYKALVILTQ